jgi:hypothetical protein
VERQRKERRGKIHLLLHPCTRAPDWNSLCWLVEREKEEKGRRRVALW